MPKTHLPTSLFANVRHALGDPRLVGSMIGLFATILLSATFATYDAVLVVNLTQSTDVDFISDTLITLIFLRMVGMLVNYIQKMIRMMIFIPRVEKIIRHRMWSLVRNACVGFLMDMEEDPDFNLPEVMAMGIQPQVSIISGILQYSKPIIYTASQMYIVFSIAGWFYGVCTLVALVILILIGLLMINMDYVSSKDINKKTKADTIMATSQAKSFVVNTINGRGDQVIESMVSLMENRKSLHRKRRCKRHTMDLGMELINILIPIGLVYSALHTVAIGNFIPLFHSIIRACDYAWWLLYSIDDLFQTCAGWGPMEDFLGKYVVGTISTMVLDADAFHPSWTGVKRMLITGKDGKSESGAGKSTLVKRWIRNLSVGYAPGQWMYMKQQVCLEHTHDSILEVMSQYYPSGMMADKTQLVRIASMLKVDSLINLSSLSDKFIKPSVGEKQCIKIIQFILPLLDDRTPAYSNVKVVLLDEASSGMDSEKIAVLYGILDQIIARGIKVIEIDHSTVASSSPRTVVPVYKHVQRLDGKKSTDEKDDEDDDLTKSDGSCLSRFMLPYRRKSVKQPKTALYVWTDHDPIPDVVVQERNSQKKTV